MKWMTDYGFQQSKYDQCLFLGHYRGRKTPSKLRGIRYVPILVDDISTYIDDTKEARRNYKRFIEALNRDYPTKDMGDIEFYLKQAITTKPDNDDYSISQEAHIAKMLEKDGMSQCNTAKMPFDNGLMKQILRQGRSAPEDPKSDPPVDITEYKSIMGSLGFPAVMSRPDISNTVSVLQRFQSAPRQSHKNAARQVQRYLQGTKHLCLRYHGGEVQLSAHVDSSWGDDVDSAESQYGWCVFLCGGPVAWKSGLQRCTATSSTEAEYIALADLVCELIFLTGILEEMGYPQRPVGVGEDNSGVSAIAKNEGKYSHRRHINIKFHLCQKYLDSVYYLRDVSSSDNTADILTKSQFTRDKFIGLRDRLLSNE